MAKERKQTMDIAQRVRLYEAGKLVYDENPKIERGALLAAARKLIPPHLRTPTYHNQQNMFWMWVTEKSKPVGKGEKVSWHPNEWSKVIRAYEKEKLAHPAMSDLELTKRAIATLPPSRYRDPVKVPSIGLDIRKNIAKLGPRITRPSASDPFANAPKDQTATDETTQDQTREEAQREPEPAISTDSIEAAVGMFVKGFAAMFRESMQAMGDRIGEHVGAQVGLSVSESLREMRMGVLGYYSNSSQPQKPKDETPATVIHKPASELPENLRRPKALIIGLLPGQQQIIKNDFPRIDFRFLSKDMPGATIKGVAEGCEATYVMTRFVGHNVTDALRTANGGPGFAGVKGMIDALRLKVGDDFPSHANKLGGTVRQSAAYAGH